MSSEMQNRQSPSKVKDGVCATGPENPVGEIIYRPVTPADAKPLRKLSRKAFGVLETLFVTMESGGWIAEACSDFGDIRKGSHVGAIILKEFKVRGEVFGAVSWLMSHPSARGMGIAAKLILLGDKWFEERGITRTFAIIEHYNQSSSKLFAAGGYRSLGPSRQIRLFGLRVLPIWMKLMFMVALSHALWYRDSGDTRAESVHSEPRNGFLKALGFQSLVFLILMARWGNHTAAGYGDMLTAAVAVAFLVLLFRTLPFWTVSRLLGLQTRYIAWSGGSPLVVAVAATGGLIPYPGSLYPRQSSYRYSEVSPALGPGSLMGALGLLGLLAAVRLLTPAWDLPRWVLLSLWMLRNILPVYFVVDALLPVFPVYGYLGRQIYAWKRWGWIMLALSGIGVITLTA